MSGERVLKALLSQRSPEICTIVKGRLLEVVAASTALDGVVSRATGHRLRFFLDPVCWEQCESAIGATICTGTPSSFKAVTRWSGAEYFNVVDAAPNHGPDTVRVLSWRLRWYDDVLSHWTDWAARPLRFFLLVVQTLSLLLSIAVVGIYFGVETHVAWIAATSLTCWSLMLGSREKSRSRALQPDTCKSFIDEVPTEEPMYWV